MIDALLFLLLIVVYLGKSIKICNFAVVKWQIAIFLCSILRYCGVATRHLG